MSNAFLKGTVWNSQDEKHVSILNVSNLVFCSQQWIFNFNRNCLRVKYTKRLKTAKHLKSHLVHPTMRDEQLSHLEQVTWEVNSQKKSNFHVELHPLGYLGISCSSSRSFFNPSQHQPCCSISQALKTASSYEEFQLPALSLCSLHYHSACPTWAQGSAGPHLPTGSQDLEHPIPLQHHPAHCVLPPCLWF